MAAQQVQPTRTEARRARQRAEFDQRFAQARTPIAQVSLALDYLRMRMAKASPAVQTATAEQVVRMLVGLADQIQIGHGP